MGKTRPPFRLLVGGSRTFQDYKLLKKVLDKLTIKLRNVIVVGGHAKGADELGERWAKEYWYDLELWHPDWHKHKKSAGIIRNEEMARSEPDGAVIFWDGRSPGTKDMIQRLRKYKIKTRVVRFE